ncbi:hypothetical protein ES708_30827 [subsurface metagenome]
MPAAKTDLAILQKPKLQVGDNGNSWYAELLDGVEKGLRSNTASRLAGRYAGLGLSLKEIWRIMVTWNEFNRPPLSESELRTTVAYVYRKHREEEDEFSGLARKLADEVEE